MSHDVCEHCFVSVSYVCEQFLFAFSVEGYCAFFQVVNCLLLTFVSFALGMSFSNRFLQAVHVLWILIFHVANISLKSLLVFILSDIFL